MQDLVNELVLDCINGLHYVQKFGVLLCIALTEENLLEKGQDTQLM